MPKPPEWKFWLLLVAAGALGLLVGNYGPQLLAGLLAQALGREGPQDLGEAVLAAQGVRHALRHTLTGLVFGASQWLLLRKVVRRAGWWVVAFGVGWGLAGLIPHKDSFPTQGAMIGAVSGGLAGVAQWFMLRKQVARAGWWVLASFIGTAGGWAAGFVVAGLGESRLFYLAGNLVVGGVTAGLTGLVLLWLLRSRNSSR